MSTNSITSAGQPDFRSAVGRFFKSRTTTLLLINLAVAALLSVLQPRFLDPDNLTSMFMGMTYDLLMAMGMTLVLILGGIDLSVGSVLGLSGVVITMLLSNQVMSFPVPVPLAVLAGHAGGHDLWRAQRARRGQTEDRAFYRDLGHVRHRTRAGDRADVGLVHFRLAGCLFGDRSGRRIRLFPFPIIVTLTILIVFNYLLKHWKPLNQAFYIGQNPDAAALSGIRVTLVTFFGYVISSSLAGVAAVFMTSRLAMGFFQFGLGSELNAIAGAVIGGASFAGGSGNLLGTFLGVLLLGAHSQWLRPAQRLTQLAGRRQRRHRFSGDRR